MEIKSKHVKIKKVQKSFCSDYQAGAYRIEDYNLQSLSVSFILIILNYRIITKLHKSVNMLTYIMLTMVEDSSTNTYSFIYLDNNQMN